MQLWFGRLLGTSSVPAYVWSPKLSLILDRRLHCIIHLPAQLYTPTIRWYNRTRDGVVAVPIPNYINAMKLYRIYKREATAGRCTNVWSSQHLKKWTSWLSETQNMSSSEFIKPSKRFPVQSLAIFLFTVRDLSHWSQSVSSPHPRFRILSRSQEYTDMSVAVCLNSLAYHSVRAYWRVNVESSSHALGCYAVLCIIPVSASYWTSSSFNHLWELVCSFL